ncbi:uncharacterized protein N7511_004523 [Penicillium nucicola]|uniref:uncharacterized protein n=1 Tax=Penicillium nucicola TaxID=1850975 RepID=UPI002545441A|nr:uncharacterized protein N7511_004523 [Penicillium nucicola]KAJ5766907.1 hypothetical protein N7511_004523 [Penicillium nucicola]
MTTLQHPTLKDPSNATRSTPTITPEAAVLHIGSSTFIDAPAAKVWETLTNTSTWPAWNSFVPRVTIRSQPSNTTNATNDTTDLSPVFQKDTRFILHVRMDPTSTSEKPQASTDVYGRVTESTAPNAETGENGRIVWGVDPDAPGAYSPSMLKAERVHEVTAVEGGTEVRNWEAQTGWLVYIVKVMYKERLRANFQLWVDDLTRYVTLLTKDASGGENIDAGGTDDPVEEGVTSA